MFSCVSWNGRIIVVHNVEVVCAMSPKVCILRKICLCKSLNSMYSSVIAGMAIAAGITQWGRGGHGKVWSEKRMIKKFSFFTMYKKLFFQV